MSFDNENDIFYEKKQSNVRTEKDLYNPAKHWLYSGGIYKCGNCHKPATIDPKYIRDLGWCPYCDMRKTYFQDKDGNLNIMHTEEEMEERIKIVNKEIDDADDEDKYGDGNGDDSESEETE